MKIGIIGATGKQGNLIMEEALSRGHEVTAIVRNKSKLNNKSVTILEKDLFDLKSKDLDNFDAVVDAFNAPAGKEELHIASLNHLIDIFKSLTDTRLLVVGGAGSLYVDPQKTLRLMDTKDFPEAYKPTSTKMGMAFHELKNSDISWTYLSPAADFRFDGVRTGKYTLGEDNIFMNKAGESYISYADYAIAMVDEIENKAHIGKRFTVVGEAK